ncbi:MAG: tetratricopeptide repeat protein [Phycisphaerales bacterium]|nr:tetratricopeptide repeat protein [Phycisphaerales bacterium]
MQALWEWLRDEHNRAIVGMLGGGTAVLVAGAWAVLIYLRRKPDDGSNPTTNTAAQAATVVQAGAHSQITVATAPHERSTPNPDLLAIADRAIRTAEEKGALEQRIQSLEADNERLRAALSAALERIDVRAEAGDPEARAAIDEARKTGNLTQLDAALDAEFDRREGEIREQAADWFELCRESAAVAYLRGDIDKAQSRLETILRFFPDDLEAINSLGQVHRLRGNLPEAEATYQRVLDLSKADQSWQAVACGNLGIIMQTRGGAITRSCV